MNRFSTPSKAQELIQELFAGQSAKRQQIIREVSDVHKERGGRPPRAKTQHPVTRALSKMKQLGLAGNPELGLWSILLEVTHHKNTR